MTFVQQKNTVASRGEFTHLKKEEAVPLTKQNAPT